MEGVEYELARSASIGSLDDSGAPASNFVGCKPGPSIDFGFRDLHDQCQVIPLFVVVVSLFGNVQAMGDGLSIRHDTSARAS